MKKQLFAAFLLLLLVTACQKDVTEDITSEPKLSTDSTQLAFTNDAGVSDSFNIQSNIAWTVTASADWVSVSTRSGNGDT
jgi:hypothetical protein